MKQKITILGSTGSIGKNTLDVVARHPDRYEVFARSAATQVDLMLEQCAQFKSRFAVMASAPHAQLLAEKIKEAQQPSLMSSLSCYSRSNCYYAFEHSRY